MTEKSKELIHVLSVFDAFTEEMVDIIKLTRFDLEKFQEQFAVDPVRDPQMTDRYSVCKDDIALVTRALGFEYFFDFKQYAYFIEAALAD